MLGFDATGRLALGQIPKSAYIYLPASAGSYAVSGGAATIQISFAPTGASYALTGNSATLNTSLNAIAGSYAQTGSAATFSIKLGALSASYHYTGFAAELSAGLFGGAYLVTGNPATFSVHYNAPTSGAYLVSGSPATLTRDFVNWLPSSDLAAPAWSAEGAPSNMWTDATPNSPNWTPEYTIPT